MYLKDKASGDLIEVTELDGLVDPFEKRVQGRFHSGEELQDITEFDKAGLVFPSDEALPRCWVDPAYRG